MTLVQELAKRIVNGEPMRLNAAGQQVHPELRALAEGYLQNPNELHRASFIADWLQENGHPMADSYRWYLNNAANIVRDASGYHNPIRRTSSPDDFVRPSPYGGDINLTARRGAASQFVKTLGMPVANLLQAAITEHFRPHIYNESHDGQPPLFRRLASQHEMASLGIIPTTRSTGALQGDVGAFNISPTNAINYIQQNAEKFSGNANVMYDPRLTSGVSLHADNLYHNTLKNFHDRFNEALIPHESGVRVFNTEPDPKHPKQVLFARSQPLWIPKEVPGKEETTGFVPVQSSWIAGLKYTPQRGSEMVVKKGGKSYAYPGLNAAYFRRWVAAKSPGKWWWRNIGYPMQQSRWTGEVHPMFANGADGPPQMHKFSSLKEEQAMLWLMKHISPHATPAHLAALTGWLPGTTLSIGRPSKFSDRLDAHVRSKSGSYVSSTSIHPGDPMGGPGGIPSAPYVTNENFAIKNNPNNPYRGASGPIWLRQTRAAHEMGIPKIDFLAAWMDQPGGYTGGLHWPMMGANGYIPESHLNTVPKHILADAHFKSSSRFLSAPLHFRTFEEFFKSPLAVEWYKQNPTTHQGFIDTAPGSYSRRAIERHVTENSTKHGGMPPIPDEQMVKVPLHFNRGLRYHPMSEHLLATGSLHPDFYDHYWEV
jgi:hypothetical protein